MRIMLPLAALLCACEPPPPEECPPCACEPCEGAASGDAATGGGKSKDTGINYKDTGTMNGRPPGWFQYCPDGLPEPGEPAAAACKPYWNVAGESPNGAPQPTYAPPPAAGLVTWLLNYEADFGGAGPESEEIEDTVPQYQVYANRSAWQNFIALNWPAGPDGQPLQSATIGARPEAMRVADYYIEVDQVFHPDGDPPAPWGTSQQLPESCGPAPEGPVLVFNETADEYLHQRASWREAKLAAYEAKSTTIQVEDAGPLVDQNRQWARFSVAMNWKTYDYIQRTKLYSKAGQRQFVADGNTVLMPPQSAPCDSDPDSAACSNYNNCAAAAAGKPAGACDYALYDRANGSLQIKTAWKVLGEGDDPSRYHTREAWFVRGDECASGEVALVGMHIMHKSEYAPLWLWSTFEHTDNTCGGGGADPAFCDPACPPDECPPNTAPEKIDPEGPHPWGLPPMPGEQGQLDPTQVARFRSIPDATRSLNAEVHQALRAAAADSVWQNYELVNAQWVDHSLTQQIYAPGYTDQVYLVFPPYLTNTTMETYDQLDGSCAQCHGGAVLNVSPPVLADFSWILNRAGGE
jgi:hypothetical protein